MPTLSPVTGLISFIVQAMQASLRIMSSCSSAVPGISGSLSGLAAHRAFGPSYPLRHRSLFSSNLDQLTGVRPPNRTLFPQYLDEEFFSI